MGKEELPGLVEGPRKPDLLASTMMLYSESERHVVEISFAEREEAETCLDWLESEIDAADTLESLAAENKRLREAIRQVHRYALAAEGVGYDFILSVTDPLLEGES